MYFCVEVPHLFHAGDTQATYVAPAAMNAFERLGTPSKGVELLGLPSQATEEGLQSLLSDYGDVQVTPFYLLA